VEAQSRIEQHAGLLLRFPGLAPAEAQPVLPARTHRLADRLLDARALHLHQRGVVPGVERLMQADGEAAVGESSGDRGDVRLCDVVAGVEQDAGGGAAPPALATVETEMPAQAASLFGAGDVFELPIVGRAEREAQRVRELAGRIGEAAIEQAAPGVEDMKR